MNVYRSSCFHCRRKILRWIYREEGLPHIEGWDTEGKTIEELLDELLGPVAEFCYCDCIFYPCVCEFCSFKFNIEADYCQVYRTKPVLFAQWKSKFTPPYRKFCDAGKRYAGYCVHSLADGEIMEFKCARHN